MPSLTDSPRPDPALAEPTDDQLADAAVDLLDAILGSADPQVIGPSNWWPRATSALQTAAARATCVRDFTTTAAAKLQVEALTEATAHRVKASLDLLSDPGVFARWRLIAERDAVYIAAMTRLKRADRRTTKPATTTGPDTSTEVMF